MGDKSFLTGLDCRRQREATRRITYYEDPVCGAYGLSDKAEERLSKSIVDCRKVASVLAERRLRGLTQNTLILPQRSDNPEGSKWVNAAIDELVGQYPRSALEMIEESLINLSRLVKHPSDPIGIDEEQRWLLYSYDAESASYMIRQLCDLNFLRKYGSRGGKRSLIDLYTIESKGWEKLSELRSSDLSERKQAFVAMWFDAQTEAFYADGIRPAVEHDGTVRCFRIDLKEHNNKICDEIISEIRRSRYLVADFTGNRGGVYYEAGFAHGLGIPVIWTVRQDNLSQVHFDTRQFNHIVYTTTEELHKKLLNRIMATIVR